MAGPKKRGMEVDFSGVESGGRGCPDGQYLLELSAVPEEKESGEGNPYLAWKWKVIDGEYRGVIIYDNTSLKSTALWRLKMLLECMGVEVPNGKMSLDLKSYVGKRCLMEIVNETYQGKQKPRIAGFLRGVGSGSSGEAAAASPFRKGVQVQFEYEGETMTAPIVSVEDSKLIVAVEIDGGKEEWELEQSEVTLV